MWCAFPSDGVFVGRDFLCAGAFRAVCCLSEAALTDHMERVKNNLIFLYGSARMKKGVFILLVMNHPDTNMI